MMKKASHHWALRKMRLRIVFRWTMGHQSLLTSYKVDICWQPHIGQRTVWWSIGWTVFVKQFWKESGLQLEEVTMLTQWLLSIPQNCWTALEQLQNTVSPVYPLPQVPVLKKNMISQHRCQRWRSMYEKRSLQWKSKTKVVWSWHFRSKGLLRKDHLMVKMVLWGSSSTSLGFESFKMHQRPASSISQNPYQYQVLPFNQPLVPMVWY